jgi:hypothetical protein
MGMAKMRGELADAIRASYADDVKKILAKYRSDPKPDYIEKIRDKRLKDAERLAKSVLRRNQEIIQAIQQERTSRAKKKGQGV